MAYRGVQRICAELSVRLRWRHDRIKPGWLALLSTQKISRKACSSDYGLFSDLAGGSILIRRAAASKFKE